MNNKIKFFRKALIIGATSAIANEVSKLLAIEERCELILVGRSQDKLDKISSDLLVRGASKVKTFIRDLSDLSEIGNSKGLDTFIQELWAQFGGFDLVLLAHGVLNVSNQSLYSDPSSPSDSEIQTPSSSASDVFHMSADILKLMNTNFISSVIIINEVIKNFKHQKTGVLAVITSVAGDRGRQSNFIYGSSKAGLSTYVDGLLHHIYQYNLANSTDLKILNIKPGFVDTPMTSTFKKGILWAKAQAVGRSIFRSIKSEKCYGTVYIPWFWYYIMSVITHIPSRIFWKSNL